MKDSSEQKDDEFYLNQAKVPGHPDFQMLSSLSSQFDMQSEKEYRIGYYQAIVNVLSAMQHGGKYAQGYHDGIDALCSIMNSKGRLSASDIEGWVKDMGWRWIEDVPMDVQVLPPTLAQNQNR